MREKIELSGKTVKVKCKRDSEMGDGLTNEIDGQKMVVEDWWENVSGKSWMHCNGNPACMKYGMRAGFAGLPTDNEVVYGKVGPFGHLIHVSEIVAVEG